MELLDIHELLQNLTCPSCRKKFAQTIGRLKDSPDIECPHCGVIIATEAKEIAIAIKALHEAPNSIRLRLRK